MKRFLQILLFILFFQLINVNSFAFNHLCVMGGASIGGVTCTDCSGDIMFANFWEMATDVSSIETGNPCGCSDHATKTGTDNGGVSLSSAQSDCTGSKTLLNAGSGHITYSLTAIGDEAKITLNFMVTNWVSGAVFWKWSDGVDDWALLYMAGTSDSDIEVGFQVKMGGSSRTEVSSTFNGTENSWIQVVFEFKKQAGNDIRGILYNLDGGACTTSGANTTINDRDFASFSDQPTILEIGDVGDAGIIIHFGNHLIEKTSDL
jgi:hypothetical protein